MKIIFMRHGQAHMQSLGGDSERQLTDFGHQQAQQTAQYIFSKYKPDLFIVSPYDRAMQTLKAFSVTASTTPYAVLDEITPDSSPKEALDSISAMVDGNDTIKCIVVICHMPIVARMVSNLLGKPEQSYQLAEARVLECAFVVENLCDQIDSYIPQQVE